MGERRAAWEGRGRRKNNHSNPGIIPYYRKGERDRKGNKGENGSGENAKRLSLLLGSESKEWERIKKRREKERIRNRVSVGIITFMQNK